MGSRSSTTKTTPTLLSVKYFILSSFLVWGLLGFAKIGMRVLLARGRRASGRVTRDLPKAVRCFRRFVLPARQVLFVNTLGHQILPKLFLSLVLPISGWLALRFGLTKSWGNNFAFLLSLTARC